MSDFVDMLGHPLNVGDVIGVGQRSGSCMAKLGLYLIRGLDELSEYGRSKPIIMATQLIPTLESPGSVGMGKNVTLTAWQGRTIKVEQRRG